MRKNIVAGNWKMNNDLAATKTLISELIELKKTSNSEIMIAPTFVNLLEASKLLKEFENKDFQKHDDSTISLLNKYLKN